MYVHLHYYSHQQTITGKSPKRRNCITYRCVWSAGNTSMHQITTVASYLFKWCNITDWLANFKDPKYSLRSYQILSWRQNSPPPPAPNHFLMRSYRAGRLSNHCTFTQHSRLFQVHFNTHITIWPIPPAPTGSVSFTISAYNFVCNFSPSPRI
jgi:hypothetical protein